MIDIVLKTSLDLLFYSSIPNILTLVTVSTQSLDTAESRQQFSKSFIPDVSVGSEYVSVGLK